MRYGSVAMLVLALGAAGCGKNADPAPISPETPAAAETTAPATPVAAPARPASSPATSSPASSAPAPVAPADLHALGTEPFWNARIGAAGLTYSTPEDQAGRKLPVERRDTAIGAVFSGTLNGQPLLLTVTKRICSDGMSDREYPFAAVLTIGTQRRMGCAS